MRKQRTVDQLVSDFALAVMAQADAMTFDAETGNMHARRYAEAHQELCKVYGDAGREALTSLLQHEHPDVRRVSAAFLLRYAHDRARSVLEQEARGEGLHAFAAAQALQRWEEGTWELDPG